MSADAFPCRAPAVMWAQDRKFVFLTIEISDVEQPMIDIEPKSIQLDAVSPASKVRYQFKLNLLKEIDPQESSISDPTVSTRCWLIKLRKKDETTEFWDRLTEGKEKLHWLKIDWTRWRDEDVFSEDMPFGGMDEMNDYQDDSSDDDGALPSSDSSDSEADSTKESTDKCGFKESTLAKTTDEYVHTTNGHGDEMDPTTINGCSD